MNHTRADLLQEQMTLTQDALLDYLEQKHAVPSASVEASTALFSDGHLDSFSMVDLILFIEENTGISVSPGDVTLDNLDSIDRILRFVGERVGDSAA